jgi:16S rRNA G527 N7-methylase RsmG
MDRIATRPPEGVALKDSARKRPQFPQRATPCVRLNPVEIFESEVEKIRDRALLDYDAAIHIGFAESELGIDKDAPLSCPLVKRIATGPPLPSPNVKVDPPAVET